MRRDRIRPVIQNSVRHKVLKDHSPKPALSSFVNSAPKCDSTAARTGAASAESCRSTTTQLPITASAASATTSAVLSGCARDHRVIHIRMHDDGNCRQNKRRKLVATAKTIRRRTRRESCSRTGATYRDQLDTEPLLGKRLFDEVAHPLVLTHSVRR